MFRNFLAVALIALAPLSAQAITVTPDDNVLGNEIADIGPGGAPIIGDGYSVVRNLRTFIFDIDLAKHDLDLSLQDAAYPGNYVFNLITSSKITVSAILSYMIEEFVDSPFLSYQVASVGSDMVTLNAAGDLWHEEKVIFDVGDSFVLYLPFDGAHGASGYLKVDAEPAPVPLPGALALSLTALAGFGAIRRRARVVA